MNMDRRIVDWPAPGNAPPMPASPIRDGRAWTRATLRREDWLLPLPADCLAEVADAVEGLRRSPIPTIALGLDDVDMPACRAFMRDVRRRLDEGPGFAVLDRLPVDAYSKAELTAVYWLLSWMIARPVAQSFDGTLLYDVIDTGKKIATRVRGDLTNQELTWHSDYGFNRPSPYIGLVMLHDAISGGDSFVVSFTSACNAMLERAPERLARLFRPYHWNRQGEHPEGDPVTSWNPVFSFDGTRLKGRFNGRLIRVGHELAGEPLDAEGAAALQALLETFDDPSLWAEFRLEPGQIQFLANHACVHRRTAYVDHDDPDRRRHLVRIFLRDDGRRGYMG